MPLLSREFQVFVKPAGAKCNLDCSYCYYPDKSNLLESHEPFIMDDNILERFIIQNIEASTEPVVTFSWHGGEPTISGIEFFKKAVSLQRKHIASEKQIVNGIQTNATLLDNDFCAFLASENFIVGISMDGPEEFHNIYRTSKDKRPSFQRTYNGLKLLQKHKARVEVLCVVSSSNAEDPLVVYNYFKKLGVRFITFLPLVEQLPGSTFGVSSRSVPSKDFGNFLCRIYDEWVEKDIGQIKVQIFEEAARTAFKQDHTLCIFKKTCGGVPVVERNGDFYSCDHFVDREHYIGNINTISLAEMLDSDRQKKFGQAKHDTLPQYCLDCEVRDMCNGECPKNRFIKTADGEPGLNYLCQGYKLFFNHIKPFIDAVGAEWRKQL
jgi:uncharacterized protein